MQSPSQNDEDKNAGDMPVRSPFGSGVDSSAKDTSRKATKAKATEAAEEDDEYADYYGPLTPMGTGSLSPRSDEDLDSDGSPADVAFCGRPNRADAKKRQQQQQQQQQQRLQRDPPKLPHMPALRRRSTRVGGPVGGRRGRPAWGDMFVDDDDLGGETAPLTEEETHAQESWVRLAQAAAQAAAKNPARAAAAGYPVGGPVGGRGGPVATPTTTTAAARDALVGSTTTAAAATAAATPNDPLLLVAFGTALSCLGSSLAAVADNVDRLRDDVADLRRGLVGLHDKHDARDGFLQHLDGHVGHVGGRLEDVGDQLADQLVDARGETDARLRALEDRLGGLGGLGFPLGRAAEQQQQHRCYRR